MRITPAEIGKVPFIIVLATILYIRLPVPEGAAFAQSPEANAGTPALTGVWTRKTDMPEGRRFPVLVVLDGRIYVIGGQAGDRSKLDTVEAYDPSTDLWTRKTPLSKLKGRVNGAVVVNGKIYVFGWWNPGNTINAVEAYDPATDSWETVSELPSQRIVASAAAIGGMVYLIGGQGNDSRPLNAVELYDTVNDTWSAGTGLSMPRSYLDAEELGGRLYVLGGRSTTGSAGSMEVFDPVRNGWIPKAGVQGLGPEVAATVLDGKIYATRIGTEKELLSFDPETDAWTTVPCTESVPMYCGMIAAGGRLYVIGGENGSRQVLEYRPGDTGR